MPTIIDHEIMSATRFGESTLHGKYCGAMIIRKSQGRGYPYQTAPKSPGGVLDNRPVSRVKTTPASTEHIGTFKSIKIHLTYKIR
jgi:hypothetical protein